MYTYPHSAFFLAHFFIAFFTALLTVWAGLLSLFCAVLFLLVYCDSLEAFTYSYVDLDLLSACQGSFSVASSAMTSSLFGSLSIRLSLSSGVAFCGLDLVSRYTSFLCFFAYGVSCADIEVGSYVLWSAFYAYSASSMSVDGASFCAFIS